VKKSCLIFALLVITRIFHAQGQQWSDPVAITDSLTDNTNITLSTCEGMYSLGDTLYACWEKSSDTSSTALYCRRLIPYGDPFMLLSLPNVHFKNPRIYRYNTGDTAFSVYFQTDMNGNWDIYYVNYLKNGIVSSMIPVRNTAQDETNLHMDQSQEGLQEMVWEQDGRILYKRSNTDTIQFDRNDCHNPLIWKNHIFWTKNAGGNEYIYYSTRSSLSGIWGDPVYIFGGAVSLEHTSIGNDTHGDMALEDLVWEHKNGSYWSLMDFDPMNSIQYGFSDFSFSNNIYPSYLSVYIITDQPGNVEGAIRTFASDTTGNMEIWVTPVLCGVGYMNISNNGSTDTHPQLFNFFQSGDNHLLDIWESWRNGHWQLWMTTMDILSGIPQNPNPGKGFLAVHPNPFREGTTIDFLNGQPDPGPLTICNSLGNKVITLYPNNSGTGKVTYTWDGKNENGTKMPPGIYFCTMKTNSKSVQQKIVIF